MNEVANKKRDGAGVWFPPPAIYVAGLGLAWLLNNRVAELNVPDALGSPLVRYSSGIVFISLGILILLWASGVFRRAGTAILPMNTTTQIVESGPYQLTRNPMYVAMSFIYLGLGTMVAWGWSIVLLPVILTVVYLYAIRREERYLTAKFGQPYLDYKARVRRWI